MQYGGMAVSRNARGSVVAAALCLAGTAFTRVIGSPGGILLASEKSGSASLYENAGAVRLSHHGAVLAPFADRYVVVRTLDAGSDKPVAFASHAGEENPALGVRGLRLSFGNPGLLSRQLDGIAAAARETRTETWVMAPMVATVAEAASFAEDVRARGLKPGVMVEVPSAALSAHRMLEVVDFLSIGTKGLDDDVAPIAKVPIHVAPRVCRYLRQISVGVVVAGARGRGHQRIESLRRARIEAVVELEEMQRVLDRLDVGARFHDSRLIGLTENLRGNEGYE